MLWVKRTCKDRWRQILNEADRIDPKHVLAFQGMVSPRQFRDRLEANEQLVIPEPLMGEAFNAVCPHLETLENFIAHDRLLRMWRNFGAISMNRTDVLER